MREAVILEVAIRARIVPFYLTSLLGCSRYKLSNKEKVVKNLSVSAFAAMFVLVTSSIVWGQGQRMTVPPQRKLPVVTGNNLYCAGFVQIAPMYTAPREETNRPNKVVGAYNEQDGWLYSAKQYLFINGGEDKGVHVGDMYSVVRPRGEVSTRYTDKSRLGFFVQELGTVEVVKVQHEVSVVRVNNSCDVMLLGDLLVPFQTRVSPAYSKRAPLDLFGTASGKAMGRIFMARDLQEEVARDQVVYVDLGAEDNVAPGDYLTIFRPLGKGNMFINDEDESVSARDEGFQSDEFRGGKFSNQAARKYGSSADRRVVTTEKAKAYRPDGLRKVVGEGMVVNVRERTATVVITRAAQEIVTGDWVEIQ